MLIRFLAEQVSGLPVIRAEAKQIEINGECQFRVLLSDGRSVNAHRLIVAAGRLGGELLTAAGVPHNAGKGVDFGVRLEFSDETPLTRLLRKGRDAKILGNDERTFCMNSPGRIFHYRALGIFVPGGIIADETVRTSNIGLLSRVREKFAALNEFRENVERKIRGSSPLSFDAKGLDYAKSEMLCELLPDSVADSIHTFTSRLIESELLCLPSQFTVHYPLVDWYWPVFSCANTLQTAISGLYTVGDLSGHARGLLQAGTTGWIGADEVAVS